MCHADVDLTWICTGKEQQWVQLQRKTQHSSVFRCITPPLEIKEDMMDIWFKFAGDNDPIYRELQSHTTLRIPCTAVLTILSLCCITCAATDGMGKYQALLVPGYEAGSPACGKPDIYNKRVITQQEVQEALKQQQPVQKVESLHPGWQLLKERGGPIPVLVLHCTGYDYMSRVSTSLSQVWTGLTQ
jgi:hypothetical protein